MNPQEETHKWEDPSIKCNLFISDGPVSLTSLIIERSGCTVQPTEAPVHLSKVTSSAASCILICGWRNRLASGLSRRTSVLTWWVAVIKTQGCITLTQWHDLSVRRTNRFCAGIYTCAMTTRRGKTKKVAWKLRAIQRTRRVLIQTLKAIQREWNLFTRPFQ